MKRHPGLLSEGRPTGFSTAIARELSLTRAQCTKGGNSSRDTSTLPIERRFEVFDAVSQNWEWKRYQRLEASTDRTAAIEKAIANNILGQQHAVRAIAKQVAVIESGLHDRNKPVAAIYELGPTGVGKTEMAHALAEYFFGDPRSDRLKILNMGEYKEHHTVHKITGSPPGYVGDKEQSAIPHAWLHKDVPDSEHCTSIIVFDEFDKAHPAVAETLLSVLDKGAIQARNGNEGDQPLDFSKALLLFTSNHGAHEMQQAKKGGGEIGFAKLEQDSAIDAIGTRALRKSFEHMPEFIGRLTDIVVFRDLQDDAYTNILEKMIYERNAQLRRQNGDAPKFIPSETFERYVLGKLDKSTGARGLKSLLDKELYAKVVDVIGAVEPQQRVIVSYDPKEGTAFYTEVVEQAEPLSEAVAHAEESEEQHGQSAVNVA
jgi:ATP-dependent Clp protease ATP-binding subunit ClpC